MKAQALIATFLVVALMAASGNAIGISPARVILNFTPNLELPLYVTAINNENTTLSVHLYARGDLADFVQFSDANASGVLGPYSSRRFNYTFTMPPSLAGPRRYDTHIGVAEAPSDSGSVSVIVATEMQLWVDAPTGEGWSPPSQTQQPPTLNQTNQTPPATEPPIETAQPQAATLGLILIYAGAALGIVVVIAGVMLVVKSGHKKHRRTR